MACGSCGKSSWSGTKVKTTTTPQQRTAPKAPPAAVPFKTGRIKTFFNKSRKG